MTRTLGVVGAGLCGGAAVRTLRDEGFDGRIVLIGDEPDPPYERPPLSKEYLRGEEERPALQMVPAEWFREREIETRFGARVVELDPGGPAVRLEDGERIAFDAVLLATGARPRLLPGDPRDRVRYLRTIGDADRIRSFLRPGAHLVVVGAGFIGAEVAASARSMGLEVTMLEMLDVPLERALGAEMGRVYLGIHRDAGVDLRTGEGVRSIRETDGSVVVTTTKGASVEGELVVVGVGVRPNVELAEAAGLRVEDGVVVDAALRTSAGHVFAAGDVAAQEHPLFGRLRVEHYDNALKQGAAAARSMLGAEEPFDDPHWFWSDQYDHNLQYAGFAREWDEIVVRGSVEERNFSAFYLRDGVMRAALGLNRGRDVRRAMKLIGAGARPDPDALRDEDVDLRSLLPA